MKHFVPPAGPLIVDYAEASYFDGYAFAHIAAFRDMQRLRRIEARARAFVARNRKVPLQRR